MRSKVIAHQKPLTAPRSPMITKVTKIWQSPRRESPRHVSEQFPKEPTVPEPFPLRSEYLSAVYKKDFENRIQEELRQQKESAEFKALPLKIVPAFLPERSRKPLTETMNVQLRSDVRATQRATFDQQLEAQRVEKAYILDHAQRENEIVEKENLHAFRETLIHHARPINYGTPLEITKSTLPLTEARSPILLTKLRGQ